MNHRSVRLSSACTALVTMSGAASLNTSRKVDVRLAGGIDALRGQRDSDAFTSTSRQPRARRAGASRTPCPAMRVIASSTTHSAAHIHGDADKPDAGDQQVEPLRNRVRAPLQHRVDEALALELALRVQHREQHLARRLAESVVRGAPQHLRGEKHGRRRDTAPAPRNCAPITTGMADRLSSTLPRRVSQVTTTAWKTSDSTLT